MKKILLCMLLGILCMSVMWAGGKAEQSKTNKDKAVISFWFPSEGVINDQYFFDAIKRFETKNPSIAVEVTKLPTNNTEVDLKLNAAQLNDEFPDVFSSYLTFIAPRGSKGDFENLKPYLDSWPEANDIMESALEMGKYKGTQYGIGFFPSPQVFCYRKDYFKEAGLDPEKPPKTWDEIRTYAAKLVKKDSSGRIIRAGYDIPALNAEVYLTTFMRQAGSVFIDEMNDVPVYTDAGGIEGLEFMLSMKSQSIPYDATKFDDFPFMKGNSAMSVINTAQLNKLIAPDSPVKDLIGFGPVTTHAKKSAFCGYRLYTMSAKSKYKTQSWELIKFLMGKEEMLIRARDLNIPNVRKSLESEYIKLKPELNLTLSDYVKYGKGVSVVPWIQVSTKNIRIAYEEAYSDKKTALQALKDAETIVKKELETLYKK